MAAMISPRIYYPGDLIYTEGPFAYVLRRSLKFIRCETCHKRGSDLKACKNCRAVKYCDRECQKINWEDHKLECRHLQNLPEGPSEDFVRLLGKVILKVKDKKWKSIQKRVFKTDTSFDGLDSKIKEIKEDHRLILFCKEAKELTRQFIGERNLPQDDELFELIGKVKYNSFIDSYDDSWTGVYLFIGLNAFGHECVPNANVEVCKNSVKVWACKKIKKGSDKIAIDIQNSGFRKLMVIGDQPVDRCRCTDCSLPYRESTLSKVLDESKAFSVILKTERYLQLVRMLDDFDFELDGDAVDDLFEKMEGVLGRTHKLRLKLLSLKCSKMGGPLLLKLLRLRELECSLRMVYGDHNLAMKGVYGDLMFVNILLGNVLESAIYMDKIQKLEMHSSSSNCFPFPFPF